MASWASSIQSRPVLAQRSRSRTSAHPRRDPDPRRGTRLGIGPEAVRVRMPPRDEPSDATGRRRTPGPGRMTRGAGLAVPGGVPSTFPADRPRMAASSPGELIVAGRPEPSARSRSAAEGRRGRALSLLRLLGHLETVDRRDTCPSHGCRNRRYSRRTGPGVVSRRPRPGFFLAISPS